MVITVAAQILSIIGMVIACLSFQAKKNKSLCLCQALSSLVFAVSFIIIGGYTGAMSNIVNVFRGTLFGYSKGKVRNIGCVILEIAYILVTVFTYSGFFSVLVLIAQMTGTIGYWYNKGKIIRIIQFFVISPIWLAYDIRYFSLGGIICECITLISVIVSVCRFGLDGFETEKQELIEK